MSASSPCPCLQPLISLLFVSLSCPIFVSWGRSRSASKVCGKLRFLFATNSSILQDMSITQSQIFLLSSGRIVILCSYWSAAAQLFQIVSISAYIHSSIMFYDVLWCSMMFYDVLWYFMSGEHSWFPFVWAYLRSFSSHFSYLQDVQCKCKLQAAVVWVHLVHILHRSQGIQGILHIAAT